MKILNHLLALTSAIFGSLFAQHVEVDPDGDGFTTREEEEYGSDPLNSKSYPIVIDQVELTLDAFRVTRPLEVLAPTNKVWLIESSPWIEIPSNTEFSGDNLIQYSVDQNLTGKTRSGYIKISSSTQKHEWITETIELFGALPSDAKLDTSLNYDLEGNIGIAFYDYIEKALKFTQKNNDDWVTERVTGLGRESDHFKVSLAYNPQNQPTIAYIDRASGSLNLASKINNQWIVEVIHVLASGTSGSYKTTSLAYNNNGDPLIAYHLTEGSLHFAEKKDGFWQITNVDSSGNSTGGYTSLSLDQFGNPGVAYFSNVGSNVRFASRVNKQWSWQTVDAKRGVGVYSSADYRPDGLPAVAYKDYFDPADDLRYAVYQNGNWDIQTVVSEGNVGSYASLDHNSLGEPAISYLNRDTNDLHCVVYLDEEWQQYRIDETRIGGRFTSLKISPTDQIHISYISKDIGSLRLAKFDNLKKQVVLKITQKPLDSELEKMDTDRDGIKDIFETDTGIFASLEDTGTDPFNPDTDGDGLSDFTEIGSDRFSVIIGARTWNEAFDDAVSKGGNLATFVTTRELDTALSTIDLQSIDFSSELWIGAEDREGEGVWKWVTGEEMILDNWAENQPDNSFGSGVATIGAGTNPKIGMFSDVPATINRDAYILEIGYPSDPFIADTDNDGYTDGEEFSAGTRPDDADDKPEPSPILDNIEITIVENQDNKELLSLNPSHPNDDEVTIEIFDNPDVDQDGVGAFGIVNNKVQINDFDDFDFELQTSLQLTLRLRSDKSVPVDSLVTIQLIDDRDEDFDGDGIIESVEEDVHGTSDTSVDSDSDGLSDAFEIGYGRFEIVKGIFSWSAAISDAASRGGHLATFPSQSKWDVAIDSLGERPFQNFNRIWIGLSNEGKWSWVDGSDLTYERWGIAQPTRYTRAMVSGVARGRTAGAWYALGINSTADGFFLELGYPTDPSRADTDNDGVDDKDEIDSGTNPVVADDFFVGDDDRDGWKDEAERLFGSNPEDPESVPDFQLQVEINESNEIELFFPGEKGESYQIQFSENLEEWLSLEGLILGSGATIRQVVPMLDDFPFYRVKRK